MGIIYGLKVNLSVAIVGMVNHTGLELMNADHHHSNSNTVSDEDCKFDDPAGNATVASVEVSRSFTLKNPHSQLILTN